MSETNPRDLARAASGLVDEHGAASPEGWPAEWLIERFRSGPPFSGAATITYTTVRDQALAITAEDDVLQRCVADLVAAGAGEDAARAAVATVVGHALTKGIIRVG